MTNDLSVRGSDVEMKVDEVSGSTPEIDVTGLQVSLEGQGFR